MTGGVISQSSTGHVQKWSVSLLLFISGLALMGQGLYLFTVKVSHMGTFLPSLLGVALMVWSRWRTRIRGWLRRSRRRMWLWRAGMVCCALALAGFMVFSAYIATPKDPPPDGFLPRWIVVLGSSTPNEKPSPALQQRLDLVLRLAERYPEATVITSGGVDFKEVTPEARVMARYLQSNGLVAQRILEEDRSTSTYENLKFSKRVSMDAGGSASSPMLIVTSDFHTMRAGWIARKAGLLDAYAAGAPTPLYMRYNAWLREYLACMSGFLFGEF